jgi:NAD-dependent dihydropyrimidine dehydrogenase PreA subunit
MPYFRVNDKCNGCLSCVENCPASALSYNDRVDRRTLQHNMTKCARCGQCWRVCPQEAIEFQHLLVGQWDDVVTLDLLRCRVCGEPLYTTAYQQKFVSKVASGSDTLCPQHRQRQAALKRPLSRSDKTPSTLENK